MGFGRSLDKTLILQAGATVGGKHKTNARDPEEMTVDEWDHVKHFVTPYTGMNCIKIGLPGKMDS